MDRPSRSVEKKPASVQLTKTDNNHDKTKSRATPDAKKLNLIAEKKQELDQINQIKRTSEQLAMHFDHMTNIMEELTNSVQDTSNTLSNWEHVFYTMGIMNSESSTHNPTLMKFPSSKSTT
ncbi:hypothetical protein EC973_007011 [Apophysomyces ossiformis]|uniref:DASH complex subunit DAD2 n=1 Tax=Apophysomyces ossiformis TaxID=679940 RepID=A0A8H7BY46_9FUNG|nr:hypothetical protein EC973_007011 [Apophysomyces ossiformis]